jgi:hypothetical protein
VVDDALIDEVMQRARAQYGSAANANPGVLHRFAAQADMPRVPFRPVTGTLHSHATRHTVG